LEGERAAGSSPRGYSFLNTLTQSNYRAEQGLAKTVNCHKSLLFHELENRLVSGEQAFRVPGLQVLPVARAKRVEHYAAQFP
jgi:hypothetical protein